MEKDWEVAMRQAIEMEQFVRNWQKWENAKGEAQRNNYCVACLCALDTPPTIKYDRRRYAGMALQRGLCEDCFDLTIRHGCCVCGMPSKTKGTVCSVCQNTTPPAIAKSPEWEGYVFNS